MSNIRIFLRAMNGDLQTLAISEESSIKELKNRVKKKFNLPVDDDIRIVYISRDLYDVDRYGREQFLKDYGITNDAYVFVFARIQ